MKLLARYQHDAAGALTLVLYDIETREVIHSISADHEAGSMIAAARQWAAEHSHDIAETDHTTINA